MGEKTPMYPVDINLPFHPFLQFEVVPHFPCLQKPKGDTLPRLFRLPVPDSIPQD